MIEMIWKSNKLKRNQNKYQNKSNPNKKNHKPLQITGKRKIRKKPKNRRKKRRKRRKKKRERKSKRNKNKNKNKRQRIKRVKRKN